MEMSKQEALSLIDNHKNSLLDPSEMLHWTWLRVIILRISDDQWETAVDKAADDLSR